MTESAEGAERELVFGPVISGPAAVAVHKRLLELEAECASLKSTNSKLREALKLQKVNVQMGLNSPHADQNIKMARLKTMMENLDEALASKESESGK